MEHASGEVMMCKSDVHIVLQFTLFTESPTTTITLRLARKEDERIRINRQLL